MFKTKFAEYACVGDTIQCKVDGLTVLARLEHDEEHGLDDDDSHNVDQRVTGCDDAQQAKLLAARESFERGDWFYCGVKLIVSKNGVVLDRHAASLWCVECNYPGGDNSYLTEIANELLPDAIEAGKLGLAKLKE